MTNEFDGATDFMNEIIAVASIIPNNPILQERILTDFNESCKVRLFEII